MRAALKKMGKKPASPPASSSSSSSSAKRKGGAQDGNAEKRARSAAERVAVPGFPAPRESVARRLVAWNVNGLRACIRKGFVQFVEQTRPDVLALSEVKCTEAQVSDSLEPLRAMGYHVEWDESKTKKGYSGVAILSLERPLSVTRGLGEEGALDEEGRTLTAEFDDFFFVSSYVPNSGQKLARLDWRVTEWDAAMLAHLGWLEQKGKPFVWAGDHNVARTEIDLANPKGNKRTAGFTVEERESFESKIIGAGYVDTFRHLYPDKRQYSYFSQRFGARSKDKGWRLDYMTVPPALMERVDDSWIAGHEVLGSDHVPVVLDLK